MAAKPDPGKPIKKKDSVLLLRDWLNELLRLVLRNQILLGGECGIDATVTPTGTHLRLADQEESMMPAYVTEAITTRSGSTPGEGEVALMDYDEDDDEVTEDTETVEVKNLLIIAESIEVGKVIWVRRWRGQYWVSSGECATP